MGAKASTSNGGVTGSPNGGTGIGFSNSSSSEAVESGTRPGFSLMRALPGGLSGPTDRQRARSLSSVPDHSGGSNRPESVNRRRGVYGTESPETDNSSQEEDDQHFLHNPFIANTLGLGRVYAATSLPAHIWSLNGIKCPVCNKFVLPDDIECHLVMCLTKPRLTYNDDVLTEDKGECVICLEDLQQGDTIARLPCLCIYHKSCIDQWFQVNRSCPEHPED